LGRIEAQLRVDGQFQVEPKGASRHLLLFEIGAIGEPFALALPPRTMPLRSLATPLPVRFTVLEEKFVGSNSHDGHLTELSAFEPHLEATPVPAILSNVRITFAASQLNTPAGEIYGKVVDVSEGTPSLTRVRFTSTTPELKAWVLAQSA